MTTAATPHAVFLGRAFFIDPKRELVIVTNANWAGGARDPKATEAREAFYREVQGLLDGDVAVSKF